MKEINPDQQISGHNETISIQDDKIAVTGWESKKLFIFKIV